MEPRWRGPRHGETAHLEQLIRGTVLSETEVPPVGASDLNRLFKLKFAFADDHSGNPLNRFATRSACPRAVARKWRTRVIA